jgi:hypothetical protein
VLDFKRCLHVLPPPCPWASVSCVQSDDSRRETNSCPTSLTPLSPLNHDCRVCWEPVVETSKTDENGQANHEECNDRQLSAQKGTSSPKT